MDTTSLADLGPVIASILGPMLAFVAVSMRYQHVDSTRTRALITNSEERTRQLIANSEGRTGELITDSENRTRELIANSENRTRELITDSENRTRELIERSSRETLETALKAIGRVSIELAEHKKDTKEGLRELARGLADTRERLARIEGSLGIGAPRPGEAAGAEADAA